MAKIFLFWSKSSGRYRKFESLLKSNGWHVQVTSCLRDYYLTRDVSTKEGEVEIVCFAIMQPTSGLSETDMEYLHEFYNKFLVKVYNCILFARGFESDDSPRDDLNKWLSRYGIEFRPEIGVLRPNPYKFYHPMEVLLEDFITNRSVSDRVKEHRSHREIEIEDPSSFVFPSDSRLEDDSQAKIVYPKGCCLGVDAKKAAILMTSSPWALPSNQAICALHENQGENQEGGRQTNRMIIVGSSLLFSDEYISKENNYSLSRTLVDILADRDFSINVSDARTVEIPDDNMTPDTSRLCESPIACLQQSYLTPAEPSNLVYSKLFNLDTNHLPKILRAYKDLNIHEAEINNTDAQERHTESRYPRLILPELDLPYKSPKSAKANRGFIIRRIEMFK